MDSRELIIMETAAYLMINRDDIDTGSELGTSLFSVWSLVSPFKHNLTIGTGEGFDICVDNRKLPFSAHAHISEPMTPSPDDFLRCSQMPENSVHFITDRFRCVRFI